MKYLFSACFATSQIKCLWLTFVLNKTWCIFFCFFFTAGCQFAATWILEYSSSRGFFFSFSELNQTLQWIEDPLHVFLRSEYQWWKKKHLLSLLLDIRKILFFTHRYLHNSFIKIEGCCGVTGEKDFFLCQKLDVTLSVRDSIDIKALVKSVRLLLWKKMCIFFSSVICSENLQGVCVLGGGGGGRGGEYICVKFIQIFAI